MEENFHDIGDYQIYKPDIEKFVKRFPEPMQKTVEEWIMGNTNEKLAMCWEVFTINMVPAILKINPPDDETPFFETYMNEHYPARVHPKYINDLKGLLDTVLMNVENYFEVLTPEEADDIASFMSGGHLGIYDYETSFLRQWLHDHEHEVHESYDRFYDIVEIDFEARYNDLEGTDEAYTEFFDECLKKAKDPNYETMGRQARKKFNKEQDEKELDRTEKHFNGKIPIIPVHYFYGGSIEFVEYVSRAEFYEKHKIGIYQALTPEVFDRMMKEKEENEKPVKQKHVEVLMKEIVIHESDHLDRHDEMLEGKIMLLVDKQTLHFRNLEIHRYEHDEGKIGVNMYRDGKNFIKMYQTFDEIRKDIEYLKKRVGTDDEANRLSDMIDIAEKMFV